MTTLEHTVINALYDLCEYDQCTFEDLADDTSLSTSVLRGVVSSLQKKGVAKVRDTGHAHIIIVENTEWPCDVYDEDVWAFKKAQALKGVQ